jgi:hypothetical protein
MHSIHNIKFPVVDSPVFDEKLKNSLKRSRRPATYLGIYSCHTLYDGNPSMVLGSAECPMA